jgi:hypothetical protein
MELKGSVLRSREQPFLRNLLDDAGSGRVLRCCDLKLITTI